jgi:TonB family protein
MTIEGLVLPSPQLPPRRLTTSLVPIALAAAIHAGGAFALSRVIVRQAVAIAAEQTLPSSATPPDIRHIVFIARGPVGGGGGGGGGNRQQGPIRHAEGVGRDPITLRVRKPVTEPATTIDRSVSTEVPLPAVVLDARPMASGTSDQIGLPVGGVTYGTSTGPGSGGGVGEGVGTGIGPGRGPGVGEGIGGGTGGGVFRPGSAVTPPRVLREVKPTYTNHALFEKIQGTVLLELVVTDAGKPTRIRVIRSLDPEGLDEQAVFAASQWEFEPGRLAGKPVNVVVTIALDFTIR